MLNNYFNFCIRNVMLLVKDAKILHRFRVKNAINLTI